MATDLKAFRDQLVALREEMTKAAFLPMPGDMPQPMQQMPQGDPNAQMQAAAPQVGPMPQQMPPQQMPPQQDPSQGMPAQDPGAMPDTQQVLDQITQGLEELFQVVQQMGQAIQQLSVKGQEADQKISIIVNELSKPAPAPAALQQAPIVDPNAAAAQMAGAVQPQMI